MPVAALVYSGGITSLGSPSRLVHRYALGPVASQSERVLAQGLARNTDPFPTEAVRDLLGITRALYRAELAAPPPPADRARIEKLLEIGKQYRLALDLGAKGAPDSMGGRAARGWADKATASLGEFVASSELMEPAVRATAAKLRRSR